MILSAFGRRLRVLGISLLGCAMLVACSTALLNLPAQTETAGGGQTVARLSLLEGEVHIGTAGYNAETLDAAVNMPLAAGESVRTGANSNSEVEFPDGSVLRSTANSSATVIRLQPQTEIGLDDGLYYLELRAATDSQFVVYAGDLSIEPKENASFRVLVRSGQPEIAVLRGVVSVTHASSYTADVQHGESLRPDPKDDRRYLLADAIGPEPGDQWNERRAQQVADASASQTIARDNYSGDQGYGWSDLDSNGAWYPLPGEGLVWQPYGVDASFDPYGLGSWVYGGFAGGGGYVWASGYSWGWLPFHCGSWGFFPGFGWGWQPAAGCRSYGGGWPAGGFPVKHPPRGWHGPLPIKPPVAGGIVVRHPTLPVALTSGAVHQVAAGARPAQPIQVNGVTLHPLSPVAPPPTPHGSSAVGSALRRDYPVQNGTHIPVMGLESGGVAALPGRAPEWHAPVTSRGKSEAGVREQPGSTLSAEGTSTEAAVAAPERHSDEGAVLVQGGIVRSPSLAAGWHSRIPSSSPLNTMPAGAGAVLTRPAGIRMLPGGSVSLPAAGSVPAVPPVSRTPVITPPVRTAPSVPGPVRIAPAPSAPAPHFSPPPAPPPVHMSAPAAPPPSRSK